MIKPDLPNDAVEMVRAIRDRNYEITKNMTSEQRMEYEREKVERFRRCKASIDPLRINFNPTKKS